MGCPFGVHGPTGEVVGVSTPSDSAHRLLQVGVLGDLAGTLRGPENL
ncbi:hypothetical protein SAZ11_19185 [Streptomyces sp. FXJ1.4098]|nr:hypothetical protein [Streptomyces sp. FXJ1.4098]